MIDDLEPQRGSPRQTPASPVDGVEITRYPLVDPETGEVIAPSELFEKPSASPLEKSASEAPPRQESVILWSLAVHFLVISFVALATIVVMSQLGVTPSTTTLESFQGEFETLRQRTQAQEISSEQAETEGRQLLERHGFVRLALLMTGPILFAFFISGLIIGKLWRPRRLIGVSLSGLVFGLLCSLCLINTVVWPLAVALSLLGAFIGRRWRATPR